MALLSRLITAQIERVLARGKSILLLGPRQTGKTTMIEGLNAALFITLVDPLLRQSYERDPNRLVREVVALKSDTDKLPLVIIDEIQKVPNLTDAVQYLVDRKIAQFILTGSSARKLRRHSHINLLPGRVVVMRMDALMLDEIPTSLQNINDLLINGTLPGIITEPNPANKDEDLIAYVTTYLEEEIRAEAVVRQMGVFTQFLRLAAIESGHEINFDRLSQAIGVSAPTVKGYYEVLLDCLIAERIEPLVQSHNRRRLIKSPRFLIYDMGVRRIAAREGHDFPQQYLGHLFEQWVGLELLHQLRAHTEQFELLFWRDANGPEVDYVIHRSNQYIPIEVKWTNQPNMADARHLKLFLSEYHNASYAYVICRVSRKQQLADNIFAIPWQQISSVYQ